MMRIAYFTNIAPHYRYSLWKTLISESEFEFHFFFGKISNNRIKEIDFGDCFWVDYRARIKTLRNFWIHRVLVWQKGVIKEVLCGHWDGIMFLGDMFILSTWISAIIARIKGIPIYYWGHGFYGNESYLKFIFRKTFLRIADYHFLYSNHARNEMMEYGFNGSSLYVIYNSLNYSQHLQLRESVVDLNYYRRFALFKDINLPVIIFIGRLVANKRLDLLIRVVELMNEEGERVNLVFVGDGPMLPHLKSLADEILSQVYFFGPCYDEEKIGKLLSNASLCISPGNIGLTAIHALSFGTPVITHNNVSNQGPEVEVIEEGITGAFFEEGNIIDLKNTIHDWLKNHPYKDEKLIKACYSRIDKYYNPISQLKIFKSAFLGN